MSLNFAHFINQIPISYEWCCPKIIDTLCIDLSDEKNFNKPKTIMQVNHLSINSPSNLPNLNLLIKMFVMPIKSITINLKNYNKIKVTPYDVE